MSARLDLDAVNFDKDKGTVVVVAQDAATGRVVMVANADREALERTIDTGEMHYRSRTRGLWRKGATSGNVQRVVSLTRDCDGDAVLACVIPAGPACHSGAVSCFDDNDSPNVWSALAAIVSARQATVKEEPGDQSRSYTRKLLLDRNLRLKKIGEEAAELVTACADGNAARSTEEAADLVYHVAVALEAVGSSLDAVAAVLWSRSQLS
jgi:phosphoribosyl-ATP pyrophosphohydrolase/phosphoribosyl-AMP cyclohydrolase